MVYSYFPILRERQASQAGFLSGGQQQMLAIGRALMARPKLMLLDEPSLGLSPILVKEIFGIIRRLNQEQNVTMLLVEQNANMALKTAHYGYVLEVGRIVLEGACAKLIQNEDVREFYLGRRKRRCAARSAGSAPSVGDERRDWARRLEHERSDHATHPARRLRDGARPVLASRHHARPTRSPCARRIAASGRPTPGAQYGEAAKAIGSGLIALGLQPGERAAILSDNNKEWLFCDLGVLCAAGVSTGIYPTNSPAQVEYLINDCDAKYLFVEDEEQLDKILAVRERTPGLRKIIVFDMEGLRGFSDAQVMSLEELSALGRTHAREHPAEWEGRIAMPKAGDVAIIVYTSGTTGPSKGAMLTHRNIIFQMGGFKRIGLPLHETDEALNFLPLCHVAERFGGCYNHIAAMHIVNFAEAPDTVPQNLREVAPHIFLAVPRVWEKLYSAITIQIKEGTALGRLAYKAAIGIGYKASAYEIEGKPVPLPLRLARAAADWLVLKNIRVILGLNRIRWAITGAAPISPDLIAWYWAMGVKMYEVYGQTENAGLATVQLSGPSQGRHHRPGGTGHRGQAVAAGRDPAARAPPVQGLPQQAREDGGGATGRLALHRRRRHRRQSRASCASPTA